MTKETTPAQRRRRSDAERSVQAILAAALDALASDAEVSMAEIARRANVVRATIYVHFPTRESLLDAVMDHAIAEVAEAMAATEPERGDPSEALERLLAATWQKLDRFHALVAINTNRLTPKELHDRHVPVLQQVAPLIARGQKDGAFRSELAVSWHLATILALVHAASSEVHAGRIAETDAKAAMLATVAAAIAAPGG